MAQFHFVEDYERHVANLMRAHPLDEAMSLAVGGSYEVIGGIERAIVTQLGLRDGMALVDLGCGSGRLATALGASGLAIDYLGIDIVQALLDYAASRAPSTSWVRAGDDRPDVRYRSRGVVQLAMSFTSAKLSMVAVIDRPPRAVNSAGSVEPAASESA